MSFPAQLLHVLRKDVVRARYLLLGYAALVALAVYGALGATTFGGSEPGVLGPQSGPLVIAPFVLVFAGMLIAAFTVQEDSPARVDAHWLTQPLRGSAVLAAKIAFALLLLIGPAIIAQGLVMSTVTASLTMSQLGPSAWHYGVLVFLSVLLAARTRDLKSFAVGGLIVLVTISIGASILLGNSAIRLVSTHTSGAVAVAVAVATLGALAGVGGLLWQYTRRAVAPLGWMLSIAGATLLFVASRVVDESALAGNAWPLAPERAADRQVTRLAIALDSSRAAGASFAADALRLRLVADGLPRGMRLDVRLLHVEVQSPEGPPSRPQISAVALTLGDSEFAMPAGTRWLTDTADATDPALLGLSWNRRTVAARPTPGTVVVDAKVVEEERREVATLAPVTGTRVERNDTIVEIADVRVGDSLTILVTSTAGTFTHGARWRAPFTLAPGAVYALVNETRREAIRLQATERGSSSEVLVLPGATLQRSHVRLTPVPAPPSMAPVRVDRTWLRESKLTIVEWVPRTSYPVQLRAPLP